MAELANFPCSWYAGISLWRSVHNRQHAERGADRPSSSARACGTLVPIKLQGVPILHMRDVSDESLMEAYRDGDVRAFDQLFGRYRDMIYRYLVRQVRNSAVAEELFQEVWAALIKMRRRYVVSAKFKTYLFRITHSKIIDHYRQHGKAELASYEDLAEAGYELAGDDQAVEIQVDVQRQAEQLLRLLEKLPASQREVFLMHEEAQMSLLEIADILQVSRDTVKSRLRYALQRLRRGMAKYA